MHLGGNGVGYDCYQGFKPYFMVVCGSLLYRPDTDAVDSGRKEGYRGGPGCRLFYYAALMLAGNGAVYPFGKI